MLKGDGFLGTGASFGSDLTLLVQLVFFLMLTVGVLAQRGRKYRAHDWIQTPVVVLNLVFIIFIMVASFREQAVARTLPQRPADPYYLTAATHAGLGLLAEGLGIYCLLAGHKILPRKIGRLRYVMWTTYAVWGAAFLFGAGTYYVWYIREEAPIVASGDVTSLAIAQSGEGDATVHRVLLQQFAFVPQELTIVAGDTVVWVNQDGAPHNIAFDDGRTVSENFFQGETFERTFGRAGTYAIFCSLHGNPESGMAGVVHVLPATEENTALVAQQPTPAPQPPPPTPVPEVPPAPLDLIDPPVAGDVVAGILAFRDHLAPADSVVLLLSGAEPVPAAMELHAWLTADENQVLDLGTITPNEDGSVSFFYQDPSGENLMNLYSGVQVSLEPSPDEDPAPGEILYSGGQPAAAYGQIRLITAQAETPTGVGYGLGARLQAEELVRHAQYVQLSLDLANFADVQRHAEHIVNILEGQNGEHFGDLDDIFGAQNPGDGFGVIPYIHAMKETATRGGQSEGATRAIQTHAEHVNIASDSALMSAEAVLEAALGLLEATNFDDMRPLVETINSQSERLLLGADADGDGIVALSEGGIFLAYQHAQYMGAVGIIAGDDAAIVDPLPVGPFSGETQLVGGNFVVHMLDYEFSPATLTVPAGATVLFINHGVGQHSVTADDLSFDSGLLESGEQTAITFNEPGFYPFYCVLHGTRGHTGMSGSITVVASGAGAEPEVDTPEPEPIPAGEDTPDAEGMPEAEATPELVGSDFTVEMSDFTYSNLELAVPAGSHVMWINSGEMQHSARADDESWDTGLLDSGEQAIITFDTPGTYSYFCLLHGAPGGIGMAAVITVVEAE